MGHPGITYSIDECEGIVRLVHHEEREFREWAAVMEALLDDPGFGPGMGFLVDRRAVGPLETQDLHRIVDFIGSRLDEGFADTSWALVVGGTADFGMGRMSQALAADHPTVIEVFRDPDEALLWLRRRLAEPTV